MKRVLLLSVLLCAPIALADGLAIGGRVVGPQGTPIAEATIELVPLLGSSGERRAMLDPGLAEPVARGKSNARGRYRLQAPDVGLWRLRIAAEGFVPTQTDLRLLIEPVELPDAELAIDAGLTVRVRGADGSPIEGATVMLVPDLPDAFAMVRRGTPFNASEQFGRTDSSGKLKLARALEGSVTLSAAASSGAWRALTDVRGTAATLVLDPSPGREIEVLDADGAAAPDVLVAVGEHGHPIGFTSESGRIELFAAPGSTRLLLANEAGAELVTALRVEAEESDEPERYVLPAVASFAGRLIDEDSRSGVAGGRVWSNGRPESAATTSGDGTFTLAAPTRDPLRLNAGATGYLRADGVRFQPGVGGPGPTLSMRRAAAIEGRVVDAAGDPRPGAEVELKPRESGGFPGVATLRMIAAGGPRAIAADDGRYRLAPVDPEALWQVEGVGDGYAPATAEVPALEPGGTASGIDIVLQPGLAIVGTVVDGSQAPLAGAELALRKAQGGNRMMRLAMMLDTPPLAIESSGGEGRFEFAELAEGSYDLTVKRAGFAEATRKTITVDATVAPVDLGTIELRPGERLEGYVTDSEGNALEGAEVTIGDEQSALLARFGDTGAGEPDTLSDATGFFRLSDLAPDTPIALIVARRGYVTEAVSSVRLPRAEPLTVALEAASDVSGWILDGDGSGIAGASVRLNQSLGGISFGRRGPQEMTVAVEESDGDGYFLFEGVSPGKSSIVAKAAGFREGRLGELEVPQGEHLADLELTLEVGAAIVGQVFAPDGRPAIGARVGVVTEERQPTSFFDRVTTDGEGRYRLEGLAPGTVSIEADHEDHARVVRDAEVRTGDNALDLRFEGGVEVSGRVVDGEGTPIADATVQIHPPGRRWGGSQGRSESDGSFVVSGVSDGDHELSAYGDGFAAGEGQPLRVAGEPISGIELLLERGVELTGRIVGLDPENAGEIEVVAMAGDWFNRRAVQADFRGGYRIENLRPGDYQVSATQVKTGRRAEDRVTVVRAQPATLDLVFEEGLVLSGRALQGEVPIRGAYVVLNGVDVSHTANVVTDSDGAFEIEGLKTGSYTANVLDWESGLNHEETIDVRTSREVVLRLPTTRLSGRVVDGTDRTPLAGVTLFAERASNAGPQSIAATSDADGRFELTNVGDGTWTLTANKQGYAATSQSVVVQSGRDVDDLSLSMDPTEGLTLRVRLASGAHPPQIEAAILGSGSTPLVSGSFATAEGGRVRLSSVPPGSWELLIAAAGSATTSLRVTAPGPPNEVTLQPASRLVVSIPDADVPVRVMLTDAQGRLFRALGWGGRIITEQRAVGGRLVLTALPPGSWTIQAIAADGRSWQGTAVTTAGGSAEVVLE